MNAVLLTNLFGRWHLGAFSAGTTFVIISLVAEAALLFVAAQAGFLDGPRVLGNMALDSWMPHRFSQLSDRLVTKNGVYMMGIAAAAQRAHRCRHGNGVLPETIRMLLRPRVNNRAVLHNPIHSLRSGGQVILTGRTIRRAQRSSDSPFAVVRCL